MTNRRSTLGLVVALVAAGVVWWTQSGDATTSGPEPATPTSSYADTTAGPSPTTDPDSGLAWVAPADLPQEAGDVLARIDAGGPFRYDEDGGTFGNFEGLLPDHERGYYREYTVDTPGSEDRGARRIVTGGAGEYYWTRDHYQSFERIRR